MLPLLSLRAAVVVVVVVDAGEGERLWLVVACLVVGWFMVGDSWLSSAGDWLMVGGLFGGWLVYGLCFVVVGGCDLFSC